MTSNPQSMTSNSPSTSIEMTQNPGEATVLAPDAPQGDNVGDATVVSVGPPPSFYRQIQNYIDNAEVAPRLQNALRDIITANNESKKKEKAARTIQKISKKKIIQKAGAKDLVHEKIMIAQDIAEELYQTFQKKKNKTAAVKAKLKLYKEIDDELIKGAGEHSKKEKKKKRTLSKSQTLEHFQKLKKNDEGHKNNAMNSILKTLVAAIGKDSPGAMKARADLQRLLKKYPNKVPTALIQIVKQKLKKNGLGIILAIQLSATMLGLLISIIPMGLLWYNRI